MYDQYVTTRAAYSRVGDQIHGHISNMKVYPFTDTAFLVRSLRNNFMKYNLNIDVDILKLQYIIGFYDAHRQIYICLQLK